MAKKNLLILGITILITTVILLLVGFNIQNIFFDQSSLFQTKIYSQISTFSENDLTGAKEDLIKVIIEVGNSSYDVYIPRGGTVYDLMDKATKQYHTFSFTGKNFPFLGFFVEEINGISQDKNQGLYWIYYINGKVAPVGISHYKIKENDIITWKYEKEY